MADALETTVRFLHILFGLTWVGGMIYYGHAVATALDKTPPSVKGPAMGAIGPRMISLFSVAGPATVALGVWNQYLIAGGLNYRAGVWNQSLGAALIISLVMLAVGFGVSTPSFKKLQRVMANAPKGAGAGGPPAEALALQKRMKLAGLLNTTLGVVAVLLMVYATLNGPYGFA